MRKEDLFEKDTTLLFGPYTPPLCDVGDWLDDAYYGRIEVRGFMEAPLAWPVGRKKGPKAPILTPELVRAVQSESAYAVAYWWGISISQVQNYRRWLSVPRRTEGTSRLLSINRQSTPPEALTHRRGVPLSPAVRQMLLDHARAPKSKEWKAQLSAKRKGKPQPPHVQEMLRRQSKAALSKRWGKAESEDE